MKKWNMIIDVAECTNCNLCTLAAMDEYVGNDWPGYSKPMPQARAQVDQHPAEGARARSPMIDIAYVPTMCNHCDNAPCVDQGRRRDQEARRRHRADRSRSRPRAARIWSTPVPTATSGGTRSSRCRRPGPSTPISSTRAGSRRAASNRARPARCARSSVEDDEMARMARERGPRSDAARARHQAARLLPQPVALLDMLHRRLGVGGSERRRRLRRGRDGAAIHNGQPVARDRERQLRRLQIRQAGRGFRRLRRRDRPPATRRRPSRPSSASASISARSGCSIAPRHGRACPGHPRL